MTRTTPRKAPKPRKWSDLELEDDFIDDTFKLAATCGWWYVQFTKAPIPGAKRWITHFKGLPGFPDAILARDGVLLLVEFKRNDGRLSDAQKAWHRHLPPELVRVWRPRDRMRIVEELNAPRRQKQPR